MFPRIARAPGTSSVRPGRSRSTSRIELNSTPAITTMTKLSRTATRLCLMKDLSSQMKPARLRNSAIWRLASLPARRARSMARGLDSARLTARIAGRRMCYTSFRGACSAPAPPFRGLPF
ncbi:MAG: hypothetical protein KAJ35_09075 [Thermoplasmata archaeon]|nr:hypothetical protein [Thermoplasmata archaeon]